MVEITKGRSFDNLPFSFTFTLFIIIIIIISQNPTFKKSVNFEGKNQKKSPHLEIAKGNFLTNLSFNQFT
jgi:hypothetical protein